jgi:APA family basic amino acid/polyamine antiporter
VIAGILIVTGSIQLVAELIVAMFLYNWTITHVGVLMAPRKYPELYGKLPGMYGKKWFMVFPVIGIIVSLYLLYLQGWRALLYFAIWMAVGLVIYLIRYFSKKEEIGKLMNEWPRERYFS